MPTEELIQNCKDFNRGDSADSVLLHYNVLSAWATPKGKRCVHYKIRLSDKWHLRLQHPVEIFF